jgi:hypothetical protein
MSAWHNTLHELPNSNRQVWFRRWPLFDQPALANFDTTTGAFTWTDSNGTTHHLDAASVGSWRDI